MHIPYVWLLKLKKGNDVIIWRKEKTNQTCVLVTYYSMTQWLIHV